MSNFSFSHVFSKDLYCKDVKTRDLDWDLLTEIGNRGVEGTEQDLTAHI